MNRIKCFMQGEVFRAYGVKLTCPLYKSDYLTKTKCNVAIKVGDELYVADPIYKLITESESGDELKFVLDNIRTFVAVGKHAILSNVLLLERIKKIS